MELFFAVHATLRIASKHKSGSRHGGPGPRLAAASERATAGARSNPTHESPGQPLVSAKGAPPGSSSLPRPPGCPQAAPRQSGAASGASGRRVQPNTDWHKPATRLLWFTDNYASLVGFAAARGVQPPGAAVHEAWFRAESAYRAGRAPYPPFFRVVLRCVAADYGREVRRAAWCEPLAEEHVVSVPAEAAEEGVAARACLLRRALRLLPRKDFRLLLDAYGRRTPVKQLARRLGLTEGALKMRLGRAWRQACAIFRAAGCHRTANVAALVESGRIERLCLALPRPACRKPRPSCQRARHEAV
jgi:DNA-directed RNA polymerase specialized sigma24 family protein